MKYKNEHIIMGDTVGDEYSNDVTDAGRVSEIIKLANTAFKS
jgi:copper homeostasis protein